jgi:predicted peptidase
MVEALKRVNEQVKFTVYPEALHDSWTATYDNPELYEWLLAQKRKPGGTAGP